MIKKTKWFIYTVLVGLIPFFIRFFIWLTSNILDISYILNEVDMVLFGLILNVTNINEIEDKERFDKKWKTIAIGFSVIMIVLMAVFLTITYLSDAKLLENINHSNIRIASLILGISSFISGLIIFNRLTKLGYE